MSDDSFDAGPDSAAWTQVGCAVFLHAHPDDETLATGALIAELAARGIDVALVTATRGERGEVVPGPLAALAGTPELIARREHELAGACAALGVGEHVFLGQAPARDGDRPPRVYRDSGMRWVTPTLAGAAEPIEPESLVAAGVDGPAADLAAYLWQLHADVVLSYDQDGGYGHPDHVACHHIAARAAALVEIPFVRVVSPARFDPADATQRPWALPQHLPAVRRALACHATQLTVVGDEIVHSGGQHQTIETTVVLASSLCAQLV